MKTYRRWLGEIVPSWLTREVGEKLIGSLGLAMADVLAELMLEALYARWLYTSEFPDDALRLIGGERLMPRYGPETAESYKARLKRAWSLWEFAGTRQSVLEQLTTAGFVAELWENYQWNWDGDVNDWSRFWVVLRGHPYGTQHYLGDPGLTLGQDDFTLGTTMTINEVAALRALVRQWKAGHTRCIYIIVLYDVAGWDAAMPPDGTWDDPAKRFADATYIPG